MTRVTSRFLVDLLLRKAQAAGGFGAILARGDDRAGTILVQCCDRGRPGPLMERRFGPDGLYHWEAVGPDANADEMDRADYRAKRRRIDPDLWIVELDIADAQRFVVEWGALA